MLLLTNERSRRSISSSSRAAEAKSKGGPNSSASCYLCSCLLLSTLLILSNGLNLSHLLANCEPSQQATQQQRSNELSQESGFSGDLNLADGLAAMNSYGRGPYMNTKRARKMSAFMPMRGRKDGRELVGADSLRGPASAFLQAAGGRYLTSMLAAAPRASPRQQQQQFADEGQQQTSFLAGQQIRDSDPSDASGLLRLISGAGSSEPLAINNYDQQQFQQQQQQQRVQRYLDGGGQMSSNAIPRQFYEQFEAQTSNELAAAKRDLAKSNVDQQQRPYGAMMARLIGDSGLLSLAPNTGNQIMQAKLRRAFHPMRGKKSGPLDWDELAASLESSLDVGARSGASRV